MSTTVIELGDGATYQASVDNRTLRRVLSLDSDSALTVTQAVASTGVPIVGDAHPDDSAAFCSNVSAVSDDGGFGWIITCEYAIPGLSESVAADTDSYDQSNAEYVGSGFPSGSYASWAKDDPCRKRWTFELGFDQIQINNHRMQEVDATDGDLTVCDPSIMTSGEVLKGAAKETLYIPTLIMTKSVPDTWISGLPNSAASVQGAINNEACSVAGFTIPKYGAIMKAFSLRRAYWGKYATPYWDVRLEIACWYKALPTYKALLIVLQQGTYYLNPGGTPTSTPVNRFKGDSGSYSTGLLASDGQSTNTPYYRRFVPSAKYNFNLLLLPKKV